MSLLALVFVAAPYSWMNAIHQGLGMGTLPTQPVVGYLARSTSAFYAMVGGLLWVLSLDLARYRKVLNYLGTAFLFFGVSLWIIDSVEGLPLFWRVYEGPAVTIFGLGILLLNQAAKNS